MPQSRRTAPARRPPPPRRPPTPPCTPSASTRSSPRRRSTAPRCRAAAAPRSGPGPARGGWPRAPPDRAPRSPALRPASAPRRSPRPNEPDRASWWSSRAWMRRGVPRRDPPRPGHDPHPVRGRPQDGTARAPASSERGRGRAARRPASRPAGPPGHDGPVPCMRAAPCARDPGIPRQQASAAPCQPWHHPGPTDARGAPRAPLPTRRPAPRAAGRENQIEEVGQHRQRHATRMRARPTPPGAQTRVVPIGDGRPQPGIRGLTPPTGRATPVARTG